MEKGGHHSESTRKKISDSHKGLKPSKKTIKKLSESHKGKISWNRGKHPSEETCKKMSESQTGLKRTKKHRENMSSSLKGKKCYLWKGGITPENEKIRHSIEFRLWRESVFSRDNWTCQKCKIKGIYLHPHHIKNFAQYSELRFAIDNGITFCKNCHKDFHTFYGRENNNEEQIKEFLSKK
jgi:5-methylcytosine-specific restriction endonuclease McrA